MKKGFTMFEVLLVTSIFATISLAVFTSLSNGLKLWSRSQQLDMQDDRLIFFDRISLELKNTFAFSKIPFEGEESSLAFPTVVYTPADKNSTMAAEGYIDQIGRVRYSLDLEKDIVSAELANYSLATQGKFFPAREVLKGISELKFRYYYPGEKQGVSSTRGKKGLPLGIEIEVRYSFAGTERVEKRYIPIPAGV